MKPRVFEDVKNGGNNVFFRLVEGRTDDGEDIVILCTCYDDGKEDLRVLSINSDGEFVRYGGPILRKYGFSLDENNKIKEAT